MSKIAETDFQSQLYLIQSQNPPSLVLFPETKRIYDIDLDTREISGPEVLSVSRDHKAETVYFRVDRFRDYMDLSNTACVIQYVTPDGGVHLYPVPFYDIMTEKHNQKMIFPWCIDGAATMYQGIVSYSIRFYMIQELSGEFTYLYNLGTTVAKGEVLHGMQVSELSNDFDISADAYHQLLELINNINRDGVYWDILDD